MRLSPVLTTRDLHIAELSSLRMRGALRAVGESWLAAGEPLTLETRADVVAATLAPRQIADRWTAAWVWGATQTLQTPYEVCISREPRGVTPRRLAQDRTPHDNREPDRAHRRTIGAPGDVTSPVDLALAPRTGVREIVLRSDEIVSIRDLRLTSPRRTAIDLIREASDESDWACAVLALVIRPADPHVELRGLREAMTDHRFVTHAPAARRRTDQVEALLVGTARRPAVAPAPP